MVQLDIGEAEKIVQLGQDEGDIWNNKQNRPEVNNRYQVNKTTKETVHISDPFNQQTSNQYQETVQVRSAFNRTIDEQHR